MLALSRKIGQGVALELEGTEIRVRVLEIRGSKVRLGFFAPKHVGILREELLVLPEEGNLSEAPSGGVQGDLTGAPSCDTMGVPLAD